MTAPKWFALVVLLAGFVVVLAGTFGPLGGTDGGHRLAEIGSGVQILGLAIALIVSRKPAS
jgi:hypothetical protein